MSPATTGVATEVLATGQRTAAGIPADFHSWPCRQRSDLDTVITAHIPEPTRLWLPLGAGCVLFAANNFLMARLLTALPGGTVLAPTNLATVALVVLCVRRFGAVLLIYSAYGALGFAGHLGVDARQYVLHLPSVLGAALTYDAVLAIGGYRGLALAVGLFPFAAIVQWDQAVSDPHAWGGAVMIASLGLAGGILAHAALSRRRGGAPAP